jgi:hypothetical protein
MPKASKDPSYTAESLRMLESAEGQNNAFFACFGSAAQRAQPFEQSLSRFLVVFNRATGKDLSVDDFEAYERKLEKKTMGWLLHELRDLVAFPEAEVPARLDAALGCRNHLMHSYFLRLGDDLDSKEGRMARISELLAAEELLDASRATVNAMRIAMCRTLGIDDPHKSDYEDSDGPTTA